MIEYATYRTGSNNDILVLEITGRLDSASSQFLLDCIQGHIDDGLHKFILDCTNLAYISSFGLGALVRTNSNLKGREGSVALVGVQGLIADVLRIAHLDRLFHLFPTVDDAAQSFA